tara:strand:+ start:217 stop:687 length:471 start_codon:yes stop_codon:yes gene_type:complete
MPKPQISAKMTPGEKRLLRELRRLKGLRGVFQQKSRHQQQLILKRDQLKTLLEVIEASEHNFQRQHRELLESEPTSWFEGMFFDSKVRQAEEKLLQAWQKSARLSASITEISELIANFGKDLETQRQELKTLEERIKTRRDELRGTKTQEVNTVSG